MNPQASTIGQPSATAIFFFVLFVAVSLVITFWAARRTRSTDEFFVAGRRIGAIQNGFALAGDFISAAGFLGLAGLTSLVGFDGLMYAIGGVIGWPIMMFLLAESLRNLGKYTLADVLSHRLRSQGIRVVAIVSTISLVLMYIIMQMVGAGNLIHLLFGLSYGAGVAITGVIMLAYVLFGGMIATTWVQIIKASLMLIATVAISILALIPFGFDPAALFAAAAAKAGPAVLAPGKGIPDPIEVLSLSIAFAFGVASLPHVLMRFYTVPDARTARKSLIWATGIIAVVCLLLFIVGFAGMALIGPDVIRSVDRGGNMEIPLLAELLGGTPFLGFVAAVAFATILASVSGLVITGAATLSHDLWVTLIRRGEVSPKQQLVVAKLATVLLCIAGIALGIVFQGQNIAFLVGLSTAVAASANFPTLILAIFWRRLTTAGAIAGMVTGLGASVLLIYLSPLIQVDILHHAAPVIGLRNPGIISCPLAFLVAILVSLVTSRDQDTVRAAEIERQMLIGLDRAGAERA